MSVWARLLLVPVLVSVLCAAARADYRCYMVFQYDWGARRGFYIDVEGQRLAQLPLILAVADGEQWRFVFHTPPFEPGREYEARAVIGPERSQLFLDGEAVGEIEGGFLPQGGRLGLNEVPPWAQDLGDYLVVPLSVEARALRAGSEVASVVRQFVRAASRPVGLQMFSSGAPERAEFALQPGDTVEVRLRFRTEAADLEKLGPLIDEFGQCIYADWPEKARSAEDLRRAAEAEARWLEEHPRPATFDRFGGYTGAWRENATGFFRVLKRDGYWWLITPEGNPCFYLGVDTAPGLTWPATPVSGREFLFKWLPPREGPYAAWSRSVWGEPEETDYVSFIACNLIRKYGEQGWQDKGLEVTVKRLASWGFSGVGKWGGIGGLPYVPVLSRREVPSIAGHPDIFDPAVRAAFADSLRRQIEGRVKDACVVGWSVGNEWDEIIRTSEIRNILKMAEAPPAKRALLDYALDEIYGGDLSRLCRAWAIEAATREALYQSQLEPPDEEADLLRMYYADRYYDFIYRTIKAIDPNHLYCGFWITPDWAVEPWDAAAYWRLAAKHCDLIGYDRYAHEFADERWRAMFASTDKPVLCGEFSLPPTYKGMRAFGTYGVSVRNESEEARYYRGWVKDAAENPYCVGLCWFEYRDQDITGRGPGRGRAIYYGEHYAFGLTTITDQPKYTLVERMRHANLMAPVWRLHASAP